MISPFFSETAANAELFRAFPHTDLTQAFEAAQAHWHRFRGVRIFMTGGTGFVGKWLLATLLHARQALSLECSVRVLTRDAEAFAREMPVLAYAHGIEVQQGDVTQLLASGERFDLVVHAATDAVTGGDPLRTFANCVDGTRRALDFAVAAAATDFLLLSSGAVYGPQPRTLAAIDEGFGGAPDPLWPDAAYGEAKRVSEWLAGCYADGHGLRVKTARCFAFVGPHLPHDRHFAFGNFLADAMANRPVVISGDGTPLRGYLHASDMAAWLWAIAAVGRSHTAYNVGGSEVVSIHDLARVIVDATGSDAGVEVRGACAAVTSSLPSRYVADNRRALRELDLRSPLGLEESVRRTVAWHRDPHRWRARAR